MNDSLQLKSPDGLRGRTISTALDLLWATGMRPNEVCKLLDEDLDLINGKIIIRETKFPKAESSQSIKQLY